MVSECNEENFSVVERCAVAFHRLFLVWDIMGFLYVRITLYMHVGFKSVELAGVVSNALCRRTEKDVTMEYPFMIQMLGTACHASDTKQGKMSFL